MNYVALKVTQPDGEHALAILYLSEATEQALPPAPEGWECDLATGMEAGEHQRAVPGATSSFTH